MTKSGLRASLIALAAASTLAGCERFQQTKVAAEVLEAAHALINDYNTGNAAAAAAYDAPDYVGVFHGTPNTMGPAADEAGMKAAMATSKVHWEIGKFNLTIAESRDLAIFEAPYTLTVARADGTLLSRENGTWIAIFRRQPDGSMKLWRSIGSDTPPPAKPAGA
jgi:ketosteroid isomerase-like protein